MTREELLDEYPPGLVEEAYTSAAEVTKLGSPEQNMCATSYCAGYHQAMTKGDKIGYISALQKQKEEVN